MSVKGKKKSSKDTKKPTETNEQLLAILNDVLATMQERGFAQIYDLESGAYAHMPTVRMIDGTLREI